MWRIEGLNAIWKSRRLEAVLDCSRPHLGLMHLQVNGEPLRGLCPLQVHVARDPEHVSQPLDDCYVRDHDLIVTYAQTPQRPTCPQIYWRIEDDASQAEMVLLEVLVSNQTQLLDVDPRIHVGCASPVQTWLQWDASVPAEQPVTACFQTVAPEGREDLRIPVGSGGCALLARWPDSRWSYGQVVSPRDLVRATLTWDPRGNNSRLMLELFDDCLEKGVIRRARASGALVERAADEVLLARLVQQVGHAVPPLSS